MGPSAARGWRRRPKRGCARSVRGRSIACWRRVKRKIQRRQYGRTKPGTLFKHHIPLRTDHWDVHRARLHRGGPGARIRATGPRASSSHYAESDGHPHDLGRTRRRPGEKPGACAGTRSSSCARRLPFALRGIDSDNGSEFINAHLMRYCRAHADSVHARAPVQERRQRAHRAEELDARPQADGLRAVRHGRGAHGDERRVCRPAAAPESLSAVGETPAQRTRRRARRAGTTTRRRRRWTASASVRKPIAVKVAALVRQRDRSIRSRSPPASTPSSPSVYRLANHRRGLAPSTAGGARAAAKNAPAAAPLPSRMSSSGNTSYGATIRRPVTLTYRRPGRGG